MRFPLNFSLGPRGRAFLSFAAALLLASCATPPSPREEAAKLNARGEILLSGAGHDAEAEAAFKGALQVDPQFAPAHSGLAQAWARLKSHSRDEIVAEYETAIRLDPHLSSAQHQLGLLLLAEPDHRDAAIDHLRAAVSEDLDNAEAWTHLGDALRGTPDWEGTVSAYRRAASLPTADRYAWFRLGAALRDRPGHDDEAIEAFTAALKVDPNQVVSLTSLGLLLKQKPGRGAEALQHMAAAARLEPTMSINWSNLARTQYELGEPDAALASIDKALALDPRNFAAFQVRADLRLSKNEWETALADYEKVLELQPQYPEVLLQVGVMRLQRKADYAGAIDALTKALAIAPNYAAAYAYRGATHLEKKSLEAAAADVERAIKLEPNTVWYWSLRAEIKLRQEDPASALPDIEHVLSLLPNDERSLMQRGVAHYELSQLEAARRDAELALTLYPRNAFSHGLRGRIRQLTGDQAGAIADFTSAIALGQAGSPQYFSRGMSRELLDDFPRALKEYERAMEVNTENRTYIGYWALFARIRLKLPPNENDLKTRGLGPDQTEWMNAITGYLSGKIDEAALLAKAKEDPKKANEQNCEAYYYIAMHRLLVDRDSAAARPYFEKCIATNVRKFAEYAFSKRELARMDPAAAKRGPGDKRQETGDRRQKDARTTEGGWEASSREKIELPESLFGLLQEALADEATGRATEVLVARDPAQLAEAAVTLQQSIAQAPNTPGLNLKLGRILQQMPDRLADASAAYLAETHVSPDNAEAHYRLGVSLLLQRKMNEAAAALIEATRLNPKEPRYWKDLSAAQLFAERFDDAMAAAERLIELTPARAIGYLSRADARRQKGEFAAALEDYRVAMGIEPAGSNTYLYVGWCQEKLKQGDEALASYSRAIELDPNFSLVLSLRSSLLMGKKQYPEALSDISRAIALDGTKAHYWHRRGQIRLALSDPANAVGDFVKATELEPKNLEYWDNRTRARMMARDFAGAIPDLDHFETINGPHAALYYRRGLAKAALKDRAGAREDFDRGVAQDPKEYSNYRGRAALRDVAGDFAGALADYEQAIRLSSRELHYERMWCALLRRRLHLPASEQDLPVVTATSQDGWTKALAAYLAGSLSEADLQAAEQALPEPDRTKKNCEFLYYTGMQHLLENDVAGARSRFQQSVDTGIVSYSEYERAQAELKRLDEPAAGREAEDKGKQPAGDRPAI